MTVGTMESAELFDAGPKGRGLRAAQDLRSGDVVFAEPSFSAVVFDSFASQVCHSCFRCQAQLLRCAQCKFAHYCDRTCQTACWDEHKQECKAIRKAGEAPRENVRLAARIMWRLHKDTGLVSDSQLVSVEELQDHVAELSDQELQRLEADVQSLQRFWSHGRKQHSAAELSHIFGIIKCNGFTMSDQRGLQAVGVGLFPNLCLVNHDCRPNCTVVLNHGNQSAVSSTLHSQRRIELRALEKVPEGQELTVSYVDFLDVSAERRRKLQEHFHFQCSCSHCSQQLKDDLMTAPAGEQTAAEKVKEVTAFSQEQLQKIEEARLRRDYQQVVKLCLEGLQKQEGLLADTHLSRLRLLSVTSEVLAFLRRFAEAADYGGKMLEGYTQLYQPGSAALGLATMRVGVVNWHAGHIEEAHSLICRAYRILLATHGPNHAITRDLEAMRSQTETELKMFRLDETAYRAMRDAALRQ